MPFVDSTIDPPYSQKNKKGYYPIDPPLSQSYKNENPAIYTKLIEKYRVSDVNAARYTRLINGKK